MKSRKGDRDDKRSRARGGVWLLTFNDMMTLLLTFFVLLLSLSKLDVAKAKAASDAVGAAFGVPGVAEELSVRVFDPFVFSPGPFEFDGTQAGQDAALRDGAGRFIEKRDELIRRFKGGGALSVEASPKGVIISADGAALFKAGSAEPAAQMQAILAPVCPLLEEAGLLAKVEVYTGEVPADRQHFPSCWELAASRGAVVADYLASHGAEPDRVAVSGYGIAKPAKTGQRGRGTSAGSVEVTLTYHEG